LSADVLYEKSQKAEDSGQGKSICGFTLRTPMVDMSQ
jgi:hypothetical protein